jgi:peroxiredoxin Q/BCP
MAATAKKLTTQSRSALQVGQLAPDFTLPDDAGASVCLSSFRGKKVVMYFYPKDDTPGCTKEACAFRDGIAQLNARGAVVLGVSADSVESHRKFKTKYRLNFPLLSDGQRTVARAYGVWKQKSMYGRTYMGIERTTFLIDEQGRIARIFPNVKVEGHGDDVLAAL